MKTKNSKYDLEVQYQLYLKRMGMAEHKMHPIQKKQLKEAFFGSAGQLLRLQVDDISQLKEEKAVEVLDAMLAQVGNFFLEQQRKAQKQANDFLNNVRKN